MGTTKSVYILRMRDGGKKGRGICQQDEKHYGRTDERCSGEDSLLSTVQSEEFLVP